MKKIVAIPIAGIALFSVFTGCFGRDAEPDVEPVVDEPTPEPVEVVLTLEEQVAEDYVIALTEFRDTAKAARNKYLACRETDIFQSAWDEARDKNLKLAEVLINRAKLIHDDHKATLGDKKAYRFDAEHNDEIESVVVDLAAIASLLDKIAAIEADSEKDESDLEVDLFCEIDANDFMAGLQSMTESGMALVRENIQSPIGEIIPIEGGGDE